MMNRAILAKVFDRLDLRLKDAVVQVASKFSREFGSSYNFPALLFPSGRLEFGDPIPNDLDPKITIHVLKDVTDAWHPSDGDIFLKTELRYDVDIRSLLFGDGKWSVYHLMFKTEETDPSFDQFWNGYIGITRRSPLVRFREHHTKATNGCGSVLHHAWSALHNNETPYYPVFHVLAAHLRTLDEAYEAEEYLVEKWTLNPRGFNAIPGGYAGIRMMHELRLLPSAAQVQPSDRDAALERLLSRQRGRTATHFRSGHIRKLHGGERTTWVRSCWINLDPALAA